MYTAGVSIARFGGFVQDAEDRVRQALKTVIDPELGINMVDLGLLYEVRIESEGSSVVGAEVVMTLTTPGCPLAPYFDEQVRKTAAEALGLDEGVVGVKMIFDPPWTRNMMSEEAVAELGM